MSDDKRGILTSVLTPHQIADVVRGIIDDIDQEGPRPKDIRAILVGRLACITNGPTVPAPACVTYTVPIGGMANRVLMRAVAHADSPTDRVMFCHHETTIRVGKGDSFDDAWGRWSARADAPVDGYS